MGVSPCKLVITHTEILILQDTIHNRGTSFALVERIGILGSRVAHFLAVSPLYVFRSSTRQYGDRSIISKIFL